jgi:drug/metabolite transporter (DMT)-like permease
VIIFTLEPVFAAVMSYVFAGERLGWRALGGAALILAGVLMAELRGVEREARDVHVTVQS